jgi:diamine N-acetyltransferase
MTTNTEPDSGAAVNLRIVNSENVETILKLSVSESQNEFVAPNVNSLAEAFAAEFVWVRGIYSGDEAVGFVMLSDNDIKPRYYLWRFMIDQRFQRKGIGEAAMALIHDYVRTRPGGDRIYLSYVREEGGPESFYKGMGYMDTGSVHHGEHEAVLVFTP